MVTAITKTAMLAVLHSQPKFTEFFMSYLLARNSRIEEVPIPGQSIAFDPSIQGFGKTAANFVS
ncbi:MAG: hypothetical protein Q8M18_20925 [Bradyrhizobium sp.]|nr:hypothetical protein [Bradyrhizobium sp.]